MSRAAAIGTRAAIACFGPAGALLCFADGDEEVRRAYDLLPADVAVLLLTREAADVLRPLPGPSPLPVVIP